ncbi:MAG: twin-arginine translocase subunit TatC [Phycisphaeraceae bacterium]
MPLDQPDEHDYEHDPDHYRSGDAASGKFKLHNDVTMPLGDHIEELRSRLVKMLIGVVIALIGTVIFGFQIISWLAQPLLHAQDMLGLPQGSIQTDPTAGFTSVYMPVVLIAACIVAAPWIIWQAWQFVVVGLYEHEKKAVHILAPFSTVMTFLGVLFTYYVLLPVSLTFFMKFVTFYPDIQIDSEPSTVTQWAIAPYASEAGYNPPEDFAFDTEAMRLPVLEERPEEPVEGMLWINAKQQRVELYFDGQTRVVAQRSTKLISPLPQLGEYVKFAAMTMLGIVVAFQLPVVMLVLGWTKIFDPSSIASLRKYAFFGCCIAGAILTPTDIFSMIVLALPLYLLFEFGLLLMKLTFGKGNDALPDET